MPAMRRLMIFVDGENLVFRYQAMKLRGLTPREDVIHLQDALVWGLCFADHCGLHEVLRATLYAYVIGDDQRVRNVEEQIKNLTFRKLQNSMLPNYLTPCVFKKAAKSQKGKGVDVQMTVDILSHCYRDNLDGVLLLSGDGDYLPLVDEVKRCGKQCFVRAFSDGLNPVLRIAADDFTLLDNLAFSNPPPVSS